MDIDLGILDPGIRKLVKLLRDHGFNTTDSGDGVSKPAEWYERGWALPIPHVYIALDSGLLWEARRLRDVIKVRGIEIFPCGPHSKPHIQATYDPADGSMMLALFGVNDSMLQEAGK